MQATEFPLNAARRLLRYRYCKNAAFLWNQSRWSGWCPGATRSLSRRIPPAVPAILLLKMELIFLTFDTSFTDMHRHYLTTAGNARREAPLGRATLMVRSSRAGARTPAPKLKPNFQRPSAAVVAVVPIIWPVRSLPR